jgi:hypothetical protein
VALLEMAELSGAMLGEANADPAHRPRRDRMQVGGHPSMHSRASFPRNRRRHGGCFLANIPGLGHTGARGDVAEWLKAAVC